MIGNGSGAKSETDKFKKIYGDIYAKFMDQKIIVDLGGDNEIAQQNPYQKNKSTIKGFLAYQTPQFTFGIEAFQQIQKNSTIYTQQSSSIKDTVNAVASGLSIFVKGMIFKKLNFILRYDNYNPDNKFTINNTYTASYASVFKESFVLAGLDFAPMKNVHIMPNIWHDKYDNRNETVNKLSSSSYDLAARLTVYYVFK